MNAVARAARNAFTLIELMVAIAIIGVLIAILVPGFSAVTTNAKKVATTARVAVLERGLESYRGEQALGGVYPPSHGDNPEGGAIDLLTIANPFIENMQVVGISGANLLVYGLAGADQLGTPGFPDTNGNGAWWDDQTAAVGSGGAYELDLMTRDPLRPRYPGVGTSYVDEPTRASIRTLDQLFEEGIGSAPVSLPNGVGMQPLFTDSWGRAILYYRANRAARFMVTDPGNDETLGVYESRDNLVLTGSESVGALPGIDWGAGIADEDHDRYSKIGWSNYPTANPLLDANGVHDILVDPTFENTFERFILDASVKQRNEPVNRNTFLLISAGADAVYGTNDDVTNWTRD